MKDYFTKLIAAKEARAAEIKNLILNSENIDEVRSLGAEQESVNVELLEARNQLAKVEAKEAEARKANSATKLDPVAMYSQAGANTEAREKEDPRATMEYRTQFMAYVKTGVVGDKLQKRADDRGEATDLGILLPITIEQTIQQALKGHYGTLYSKVKHTNLKGGVKVPLGSFSATFNRIAETGAPSDRQNPGSVTGYVEFGYNIGEIRLAKTLLQATLSPDVFDQEFASVIVETYVKAMDTEILIGVAANMQCEGILTEAAKSNNGRITSARIISMSATDIADWSKWEKKFFGKLPVELENGAEFVMSKGTFVGNLCTLADSNGQPINKAYFDVNDKQYVFNNIPVNRVETTLFKNFDDCNANEYFGMYWIPNKAYAINSNMEFTVMRYFDNEKNEYVDKALVINDGKILDPAYLYLLKKSA